MTTIKVPDMMCENCVKRITNALTAAELTFRVDLAAKNVTIDGQDRRQRAGGSGLHPGGPGLRGSVHPKKRRCPVSDTGTFLPENRLQIVTFTDQGWKNLKNENRVFVGLWWT